MKEKLIAHNGSVQDIEEIPNDIKELYKTVWEMSGKVLVDMAADRGAFIDQSQSFNVHMANVNFGKLTSLHFYAWKKGLKTGMYYLRTKAAADAIKFTVDPELMKSVKAKDKKTADISLPPPVSISASSSSSSLASPTTSDNEEIKQIEPFAIATATDAVAPMTKEMPKSSDKEPAKDEAPADAEAWRKKRQRQEEEMVCSLNNKEACMSCGS